MQIMEIVTMARIVDDSSTAICKLPCQPGLNQLPLLCLWNWAVALVWRIFRLTRDPCIFWVHTSCRHDMHLTVHMPGEQWQLIWQWLPRLLKYQSQLAV
jgi:hypothetical protein